jgi:urea transport system permease protein
VSNSLLRVCCLLLILGLGLLPMPKAVAAEYSELLPATEQQGSEAALDSLLLELTSASLNGSPALLVQIEEIGGRTVLPLFVSMLAGNLYFDADTRQLLEMLENSQGVRTGTDIISGKPLAEMTDRTLGKIRINNRLRVSLREAIARINLLEGDQNQRRAAAEEMLRDLTAGNVALLRQAESQEEEAAVLALISTGLAMHILSEPAQYSPTERVSAAEQLGERLEGPVRNLLSSMLDVQGRNEQDVAVRAAVEKAVADIDQKVRFYLLVEQLFYGLSLGSVLLLAAIGLAVTFGVMGVINMAHGEMLMLGAYTTYVVQLLMPEFINYSLWVAVPAAFMVSAVAGVLIQRYVIRYLNGRPLETLLATFGISLILQQTVRTIFSPLNRRVVSPEWMSGAWEINPVLSFTNNRLFILLFAIIVFVILLLILKKTRLGLQVRAVTQNRDMAKAMGIRTDRVDAMTFGLGSGIAGIAGVALSQLTNVGPNLGQAYIIDSFMVVVFGGVGNLWGTLAGAFTLGVSAKFLEPATGAVLAKILTLVFIILFIQFRPKGLFPQKGRAAE